MSKSILIYGCGGHARSVVDVLLSISPNISVRFVDSCAKENETIYKYSVIRESPTDECDCFVAIGDNRLRKSTFEKISKKRVINIVSSLSNVGTNTEFGVGVFIGNFCHIGPEVRVGDNTIINSGSIVEHEAKIGKHCHVGPNSTVSGRSELRDLVFVGAGSTIIDYVKICSNVVIGAGATVVKNIDEPGIYVGTPAKKMND